MATSFFGGAFFGGEFFNTPAPVEVIDTHDGGREERRVEEFRRGKEQLRADVESAWRDIVEGGEPAVIAEAVAIVKPAMPKVALRKAAKAKPPTPNFDALSQFRLRQLMQLHQELMDEEEILLFMDDE